MKNAVKEKLARGELVASMIVRLVSGVEIVRIAKSAGFDALYIDLEHSSLTLHPPAGRRGFAPGLPQRGRSR